jgi:V-type H+-transporting ATPase subunit a
MGELWRSEEMQLIQLYIQIDAAHDTIDELGKRGAIQFRDVCQL